MVNSIIEAISISLNEEFGDDYEVHMEEIKQGLKTPCFFISCISHNHDRFVWNRYFRENQFCIQYFPKTDDVKRECCDVAERLEQCLEYITMQDDDRPVRGESMKYEVVDEILNFFVNYNVFVQKTDSADRMEDINISTNVKEGETFEDGNRK